MEPVSKCFETIKWDFEVCFKNLKKKEKYMEAYKRVWKFVNAWSQFWKEFQHICIISLIECFGMFFLPNLDKPKNFQEVKTINIILKGDYDQTNTINDDNVNNVDDGIMTQLWSEWSEKIMI